MNININKKNHFAFIALFVGLFLVLMSILLIDSAWAEKNETKAKTVNLLSGPSESGAHFLISQDKVRAVSSFLDNQKMIFPEVQADFKYNGLGLKWKLKPEASGNNIQFYIKSENTDWIQTTAMEDATTQENDYLFSDPVFIEGMQIKVKAIDPDTSLEDLQLIYFDTSQPYVSPLKTINSLSRKITGDDNVSIISREQWGANEDYRFWKTSYTEPKAFVIHHTAGGGGGDDPSATVRGIYYWHAVVLGWGDIGYNYLVDQQGNIYEGRFGGDGAVGAHTYNNYKKINYNEGTIGISILGCFEDEKSGCYNVSEYSEIIQKTLTDLIAAKAVDLDIDLEQKKDIFDENISSITSHQRLDYTLCPGNIIINELFNIRQIAKSKYSSLKNNQTYKSKLTNHDFQTAYYLDAQQQITFTYVNKGDLTLPANETYIKIVNKKTKQKEKIYLTSDLLPGESVDLNYSWEASGMGKQTITAKMYIDKQYISGSKGIIRLRVDNPNQAKLIEHNLPVATLKKWDPVIRIKYKNTGIVNWTNTDTKLFVNSKQINSINQDLIAVGEKGNFSFNLKQIDSLKKGENHLIVKLKQDGHTVQNSRFLWVLRVD